jgi:hypothetical protein
MSGGAVEILKLSVARLAAAIGRNFVGTQASRLVPIPFKRLVGLATLIEVHSVHGSKIFLLSVRSLRH